MGSRKYCLDFREAGRDSSGLDSFFNMPFLHLDDRRLSDPTGNRCCLCCSSMRFSSCLECFFIVATGAPHVSWRACAVAMTNIKTTTQTRAHTRTDADETHDLPLSERRWHCRALAKTHPRRHSGVYVCAPRCGHAHARWHVVRRCWRRQGRPRVLPSHSRTISELLLAPDRHHNTRILFSNKTIVFGTRTKPTHDGRCVADEEDNVFLNFPLPLPRKGAENRK